MEKNMKCNDLIADLEYKGNISVLKDDEFDAKLTSLIDKYQSTSRNLIITTHENFEYNLLENLIELSQYNMCATKEFILEHEVCASYNLDEIKIELYFYNLYEYVDEEHDYDMNYLSVLLLDIKRKIDILFGDDAYIDIYIVNKNIIILVEEKYLSPLEEFIRNHCTQGLNYESACSKLEYEETINIVKIHTVET